MTHARIRRSSLRPSAFAGCRHARRAPGFGCPCDPSPPSCRRAAPGYVGSPVDGWATYVATARVLTREGLVNRELLDVRGPLQLGARGCHRCPDPRLERVEVLARLPEVDHAPPYVDRARGVKQKPLRRVTARGHVRGRWEHLLLGPPCELGVI